MPNGEPYGIKRYAEIVKERYYLAKQAYISYEDSGKMTPKERSLMLNYLLDDLKTQQNIINQQVAVRR